MRTGWYKTAQQLSKLHNVTVSRHIQLIKNLIPTQVTPSILDDSKHSIDNNNEMKTT